LVYARQGNKNLSHCLADIFSARVISFEINSEISNSIFESPSWVSERITKRDPVGRFAIIGATAWRTLRATRWRLTDPPTDLLMMSPHFVVALFVTGDMYR
jgi:hypothetical protein